MNIISSMPNILTLLNLQNGFFGIISIFSQKYEDVYKYFLLSCLFDFFDGKIARSLGVNNDMGKELDSLADMISFVLVPVILGYIRYHMIIPTSIYLMCGCYRLARFNVSNMNNIFQGVPTPLACLIIMISSYFNLYSVIMYPIYLVLSYLMISDFKIIKI